MRTAKVICEIVCRGRQQVQHAATRWHLLDWRLAVSLKTCTKWSCSSDSCKFMQNPFGLSRVPKLLSNAQLLWESLKYTHGNSCAVLLTVHQGRFCANTGRKAAFCKILHTKTSMELNSAKVQVSIQMHLHIPERKNNNNGVNLSADLYKTSVLMLQD